MGDYYRSYKRINNLLGWFIGIFASLIYIITSEPTASFWDCGEYISTAYKLLVGHPPGAPLFQMLGRFFSLFAFGNTALVARMINTLTALASGFTIMFLFWSITRLTKKAVLSYSEMNAGKMIAVFGSGLVGALAYSFTDSFWFSAVEGEVYGMSSFFTAIVFWAILKWEEVADENEGPRWLILISYLIGLSIGVHLLNLLTIPSIVYVFYFRKFPEPNWKGIALAGIISLVLLGVVMSAIIPWVLLFPGKMEIFFVNSFGLPFNSGTIFYFLLLSGGIIWGLYYTRKSRKVIANTIILSFTFLLIGYSSFTMLVVRSNANVTINENRPGNAVNLLAYLNREQYGDWPLIYGPYYNAPVVDHKDGSPVYTKDESSGKYIITDSRKGAVPVYDDRFMTIFPRMWSTSQPEHEEAYKNWASIKGNPVTVQKPDENTETLLKPGFAENLRFFSRYQLGFMYFRYFMWNFVGRQNDIEGMGFTASKTGDLINGNWISGFNLIDEAILGPQDKLPKTLRNKARNKFYFLPLIMGMIGLYYHSRKHYKDSIVVMALFIMTGIAIVVYLNQYAPQPRERDYSYAASFYAFAIWIGIAVLALFDVMTRYLPKVNPKISAVAVTLLSLTIVPAVLAKDGWDDHDRSNRYTVLDIASDYLNSCAKDAVLFTSGDNDTFPLWYAQEVEGIRTDVRVCNLNLLATDWYIDEMKQKAYLSDPVPFSLPQNKYRQGSLDLVYLIENPDIADTSKYYDLRDLIKFVASDNPNTKFHSQIGPLDYFPTKKFSIPVDKEKVLANGSVPKELADQVPASLEWKLDRDGIGKNHLMVLDLLANNNWERPVYFSMSIGDENYLDLQKYFQVEGLAFRLTPVASENNDGNTGRVNSSIMYDNLMNKFKLRMNDPEVYYSDDHLRMSVNFRNIYGRLAKTLLAVGRKDSAIAVCDRCQELMPDQVVPYNFFVMPLAEVYLKAGSVSKGRRVLELVLANYGEELLYYFSFGRRANQVEKEQQLALAMMQNINQMAEQFHLTDIQAKSKLLFDKYYKLFVGVNSLPNQ